ncbi:MAG: lycopene cyclase domain-containing protein [Chitinophagales bacterium]|nr:lycopene cyclase domain-containing protein [Chitinophagales bacterium]
MFTYLALNILTVSVPLLRSFESKINFVSKFKSLFTAIFSTAAVFLIWDYFFTKNEVWSFNHDYVVGVFFFGMPMEEWMFFITIPFACIFIYEVYKYFNDSSRFNKYFYIFSIALAAVLFSFGISNMDKIYTSITFVSTALFLSGVAIFRFKQIANFFISYFIAIIPFLIVNGILTSLPVVEYNNSENLSIRIFSIPIEDTMYMLLLLLMNVVIYEWLKSKRDA